MKNELICSEAALQRLEYPQLKALLAGQTQSEPGRRLARQLQPQAAVAAAEEALLEVDEAVRLLDGGAVPALGDCRDIAAVLDRTQAAGSLVAVADLLEIGASIRTAAECRRWFKQAAQAPRLSAAALQLSPLDELQQRVRETVGPRGELLDSASFELGDLRYRIRHLRSRIKQRLEQLLAGEQYGACFQEHLITQRNGRYVVPLKSDCRGRVKGFVQDESASGQTLYLEPAGVLDDNNRLQQLLREEQREERRILLQLADLVRRERLPLQQNQQLLSRIDLRFAAGRLSRAYRGCHPRLVAEPVIDVRQIRHPLLLEHDGCFRPDAAVAIDLLLPEDCRALVVSGPNTGGKSVALKTLGLLQLMLRSGLHAPCDPDSRVHLFQRLYVDIGDEQSIADSLSTFSGHLLKIRDILAAADKDTLVLLDEAGSGTDPAEGAALIQAVLAQLCRQGAKALVTTHLGQLKLFAHDYPGIENAAVEFDPQTLRPTYRLRYGIPGASSALATARRLGLPEGVLQQAREYLGRDEHEHGSLLAGLNRRRQELDRQLEDARQARVDAAASQRLRRQQLRELQDKKKDILGRVTRQAEELIGATEAELKRLRRQGRAAVTPRQAVEEKQQLQQVRDTLVPFKPKRRAAQPRATGLDPGELVVIPALEVEAEVVRVSGRQVELLLNGKRMRQPLSALEPYRPRRFARERKPDNRVLHRPVERRVSPQLKLIGRRVEEALVLLGPFIDDARLHELSQVEIIHGAGAGILRRAVREFLAQQQGVTAFYAAPADQGGDNATIVELNGS